MVFTRVTPPYAPVQYRRPFRLRAGSTAWCVAPVHTGAVSTDRVPLLDGPEPRAHPMDDRLGQVLPAYAAIRRVLRRLVNGLDKGAPVKSRGVPMGTVTDVRLKLPPQPADDQRIPVLVEIDEDRMRELGESRAVASNQAMVSDLIAQGLRAQLELQSLITGVLYVGLEVIPGSPAKLVLPPGSGYREIPS